MAVFKMEQADLDRLLEAMKPVPYMVIGGVASRLRQANANDAWEELSDRMGFYPMTVKPHESGDMRMFQAVPRELIDGGPKNGADKT